MLFANNGRQLNLAAKTITKYLEGLGASVSHQQALELTARLLGFSSVGAAEKALKGPSRGVPETARTWEELAHALGSLSPEELAQPVRFRGSDSDFAMQAPVQLARSDAWALVFPQGAADEDYGARVAVILEWVYPDESSDSCTALLDLNTGMLSSFTQGGPQGLEVAQPPLGDIRSTSVRTRIYLSEDDMDCMLDVYCRGEDSQLYVPGQDLEDAGWREDVLGRYAERLALQFEVSTNEPGSLAEDVIRRLGLTQAQKDLSRRYGVALSVEPFVLYSPTEEGFLNVNFGWVYDADSATGFAAMPRLLAMPPDAQLVGYFQALELQEE